MGILTNALTIIIGSMLGGLLRKNALSRFTKIFGISIIVLSLVGFFESVFYVNATKLSSENLTILVISLILGYIVGEALHLEERINGKTTDERKDKTLPIAPILFFCIGGLQISGPMLLAIKGDNSLLYLKSIVDFPFAIIFGSLLGKRSTISAVFVAITQISVFLLTRLFGDFISETCLSQLCAIGYIILFFTGFNLLVDQRNKIKNVNMLPSILIVIAVNIVMVIVG